MKKLDRFILRDIVSDGSAGTVYRAEEELPGENKRVVALKVLPAVKREDDAEAVRFFGEVKVLAQLEVHPHVVTIYAMGLTEHYPWLAMEWAEHTLAEKMTPEPAGAEMVLKVMLEIGRGLEAMHGLTPPLVHQDLKPANILLDGLGNCKITDFSLATVTAKNKTHGLATVKYAAPELLSSEFGKVSPATDLYALGHIAYELALGAKLHRQQFVAVFEGNAGSKEPPPNKWMMWHASLNTNPAMVSEVVKGFPLGLSQIIGKLIAKPLNQRYGSAAEVVRDLMGVRNEVTAAVMPAPVMAVAPRGVMAPVAVVPPPVAGSSQGPVEAAPAPAPVVTAAASTRYWVRLRGRMSGPYDLAALQRQVKAGQLSRLHQLSADQVTWKSVTEVEGLYGPTVV